MIYSNPASWERMSNILWGFGEYNNILQNLEDIMILGSGLLNFSMTKMFIDFIKDRSFINPKTIFENSTFENEFVKIQIEKSWIRTFECEKGAKVIFTNKKTNETYDGYMQVESILNHMNIEPLFENISFNKILLEMKKGEN
jgi:hypothetical protein